MFMGVVDTLMVRHLGPEAIGAVGMGSSVFLAVAVFGMGILLGLDPLISQAYGARDLNECHRWLWHGCLVGGLASIPLTAGTLLLPELVESAGVRPEVLALAGGYLRTLSLSLFPLLLFFAATRSFDLRTSILVAAVLFGAGLAILLTVDIRRGREAARAGPA